MKRTGWPAALWLLSGCVAASGTAPDAERWAGHFEQGFEVEAFHPCGRSESWWVTAGEELRTRYRAVARAPYERVFAVVRGRVGPEGRFGHLGAYARELAVEEVVEVRPARQGDCN